MRHRNYKIILTVILGLFLSFSVANAKNFNIFNATTPSQSYFTVNGTSGNVGIGMTNPTSLLQLLNNGWISAQNAAGTGVVNMFKVNANDQIEVGAPLNIGSFEFSPDSGLVSFVDMPVSSAVTLGTPEGYAFKIDGDNIMTAYSESNGAGGVQNKRLGVGLTNPAVTLDVAGTFRNTLATTHSLLGGGGNVLVMADNTGALYTTSTAAFAGGASLWGGTKNADIWNGDAGAGNVGIGTTNPISALNIHKFTAGANWSNANQLYIQGDNWGGTTGAADKYGLEVGYNYDWSVSSGGGGGRLQSYISNIPSLLLLNPDGGNIGIGTTTPNTKLDVAGGIKYDNRKMNFIGQADNGTARWVKFMTFTITNAWATDRYEYYLKSRWYAGTLRFNLASGSTADDNYVDLFEFKKDYDFYNNIEIVYYKSSSTTYDVYIYMEGWTDVSYAELFDNNDGMGHTTGASTFAGTYSDPPVGYVEAAYPSSINFWNASGTSIFNNNNGNVGIGTSTPAARLEIGSNAEESAIFRTYGNDNNIHISAPDYSGEVYVQTSNVTTGVNSWMFGMDDDETFRIGYGAKGEITDDNSKFYINQAGNVGIGNITPATKLDVSGSFRNTLATTHSLLGGAGNVVVMADNTGALYATSTASLLSGGSSLWSGTLNGSIWNGAAGAGNVGIGTTNTANARLIVNGNAVIGGIYGRATTGLTVTNSYDNSAYGFPGDAFRNFHIENTSNVVGAFTSLSMRTGNDGSGTWYDIMHKKTGTSTGTAIHAVQGNNVMALTSGGNVGIGTTAPSQKLDVRGNIALTAGGSDQGILVDNSGGTGIFGLTRQNDIVTASLQIAAYGGIGFSTGQTADIAPDSATSKMFITGGGNVGIGTTAPGNKLQVAGNIVGSIDDSYFGMDTITPRLGYTKKSGYAPKLTHGSSTNFVISRSSGGDISAANTFTDEFVINASGNVGIGITNPTAKLYVAGTSLNTLATTHSLLGGAGNVVVMADNTGALYATSTASLLSGGSSLWSGTLDGTIWNGTAGAGNVGIGTVDPVGKLEISSASDWLYITDTTAYAAGVGGKLRFRGRQGSPDFADFAEIRGIKEDANLNSAHGALVFMTNNDAAGEGWLPTERMRVNSSGNVGIGTTNPVAKLQVEGASSGVGLNNGNARFLMNVDSNNNPSIELHRGATGFNQGTIAGFIDFAYTNNADFDARISLEGASELSFNGTANYNFKRSGTSLFYINNSSGNVGIGTTNPTTKLDVSGTLRNTLATTHSLLAGSGNVLVMADNSGNLYATSTAGFIGGSGSYLPLTGGSLSGALNMGGNNITNINKLTVNTIDPLYNIQGVNYSTFASSIAGGVKEEYVGRVKINTPATDGEREYVVDFNNLPVGSDLWVWRKTVDFSADNVEVLITPYGSFAQVYYKIEDNKIIFRADKPTEISYRLSGRRIDWMKWPTKAHDQQEKAGFVIE